MRIIQLDFGNKIIIEKDEKLPLEEFFDEKNG